MHWAEQYIGKPWVSGARGPFMFDCWGLAFWVFKHHYGVSLPEFPGEDATDFLAVCRKLTEEERSRKAREWEEWQRTDSPREGSAVLMGGVEMFCHVGIYIEPKEGPLVLHCIKGMGVIADAPSRVLRSANLARIQFFNHGRIYPHTKPV